MPLLPLPHPQNRQPRVLLYGIGGTLQYFPWALPRLELPQISSQRGEFRLPVYHAHHEIPYDVEKNGDENPPERSRGRREWLLGVWIVPTRKLSAARTAAPNMAGSLYGRSLHVPASKPDLCIMQRGN